MNVIKNKIKRFHYRYGELLLQTEKVKLPVDFKDRKNLFLYFDYEREFGNSLSKLNDKHINSLLELLSNYSIRATWFTVGKIFSSYPDSIKSIIENEHEVGSHTYSHIPLPKMHRKDIGNDFKTFFKLSKKYLSSEGFHSPRGEWTYKMFEYLQKYQFLYDVSAMSIKNNGIPYYIIRKDYNLLRFCTVGDDWRLLDRRSNEKQVYDYFVSRADDIKIGHVVGIGFHPWILFSNQNILEGFHQFIKYIASQEDIFVETAAYFSKKIRNV